MEVGGWGDDGGFIEADPDGRGAGGADAEEPGIALGAGVAGKAAAGADGFEEVERLAGGVGADGLRVLGIEAVENGAGGIGDAGDEMGFRALAAVGEGGEGGGGLHGGGGGGAAEEVLGAEEGSAKAATFGDTGGFRGADLAAGEHEVAGEDAAATLCGGGDDPGGEGGAEIATGTAAAIVAGIEEIPATAEGEDGTGFGIQGHGGALDVGGILAGLMIGVGGVGPGAAGFCFAEGLGEVGFEAELPAGIEGGLHDETIDADVVNFEDGGEFGAEGLDGVGAFGVLFLGGNDVDGDALDAGFVRLTDAAHGDEAGKDFALLVARALEVAGWGEKVGAADDADDHGAFRFIEFGDGFAEVGA